MKHFFLYALLVLTAMSAAAQKTDHTFLLREDVPNSVKVLNAPPTEGSAQFEYDKSRYHWGKTLRDTPRGQLALEDCDCSPQGMARLFSPSFGTLISLESTPEIYKLIALLVDDAGWWGTDDAKNHYKRTRPFIYFNEPTCNPDAEASLSQNGSYPSGHTAGCYAIALVLSEINPDNQDTILRRGMAMGDSRVICGFHWQSDVDAGYLIAAGVVARCHADQGFQKQLARAKREFAKLRKQGKVRQMRVPFYPYHFR